MYSWHDTFHLGLIHSMAYPEAKSEAEIIDSVKKILTDEFFQALEVSALLGEKVLEKVAQMCEVAKVELLIAAGPLVLSQRLNLNAEEKEERKRALESIKRMIDQAYRVKAKTVVFLSGPYPQEGKERAKEILVNSLCGLCSYAQEKKEEYALGINLEIFDYSVDKKALIGSAPDAFQVALEVRKEYPNFGLTVDLSHQPLLFEDPFYTLSLLSPFVNHVHLGNAVLQKNHPAYGDLHPRFGIPGGYNDTEEVVYFLRSLSHIGYFEKEVITERPVLSFEVKPLPGEDPDLVVANAKRTFLSAWNRIFPLPKIEWRQ